VQARERGVPVIPLAQVDDARADRERLLVPTVVLDPPDDLDLMRDEIFGPILPVRAYPDLDAALADIVARDRPLALYPFSHDTATVERILGQVLAGGVTVNDTLLHFAADGLPFGGVGASGMGAYHGRAGFDAMSKLLPVLWQSRWAASDRLRPPYSKIARLLKLLLR
jgi:coniferyl-aldehyde dehydrogenase